MRQALISALVAAVVCAAFFLVEDRFDDDDTGATPAANAGSRAPIALRYTVEPAEDSWVAGARGAGADDRVLSSAASSVCFLTKIEVKGVQGPEDSGTCRVAVDDFTGFWQVTADVPEGSRSEIRCNARCLVWE
ncbi:MAG TPA: hypothetical protein VNA66_11055 [Gammaproteobacteria bacterium]|nr:hypothetical protein [Gammaproteobacteria bacterium]